MGLGHLSSGYGPCLDAGDNSTLFFYCLSLPARNPECALAWLSSQSVSDLTRSFLNFLVSFMHIYSAIMQSPTTLNNQQAWRGQHFRNDRSTMEENENECTFVRCEHQEPHFHPPSQPGFVASDSDDLFHPVSRDHHCISLTCHLSLPVITHILGQWIH